MPTATVIVEFPEPGAASVAGAKLTVAPVGAPEAVRLTVLLKPPETAVVMVAVCDVPCSTESVVGDAETEKSGDGSDVIVSVTGAVRVRPPPVLDTERL